MRTRAIRSPNLVLGILLLLVALPGLAQQAMTEQVLMVPVSVDNKNVRLEVRIYRPQGEGPFPTLIFNHGSTGSGRDPSQFKRPIAFPALAAYFVAHGWAVVVPARRGRAGSEGLYDEGFKRDRTQGYACDPALSLPGAERALRDIAASMEAIEKLPFVDPNRMAMGGTSRGGVLSIAYAGLHPDQLRGVINFVGGWMGTACPNARLINRQLFRRGARYRGETLWLYSQGDSYYPLSHSRENFAVFQAAGGKGAFQEFPAGEQDGHSLVMHPDLWSPSVDAYLARIH